MDTWGLFFGWFSPFLGHSVCFRPGKSCVNWSIRSAVRKPSPPLQHSWHGTQVGQRPPRMAVGQEDVWNKGPSSSGFTGLSSRARVCLALSNVLVCGGSRFVYCLMVTVSVFLFSTGNCATFLALNFSVNPFQNASQARRELEPVEGGG